jgi:hypothetical protein
VADGLGNVAKSPRALAGGVGKVANKRPHALAGGLARLAKRPCALAGGLARIMAEGPIHWRAGLAGRGLLPHLLLVSVE